MTITKAERKGNPCLIQLWGSSSSGKTMSALLMARGLVGPNGKIGMIDTENRRGEMHAEVAAPWDHLDLQPPFGPLRYIEAMKEFEKAGGYGCIIIDSQSHCWEGEGGVLDQAEKMGNKGPLTWKAPKMAYSKMLNYLLRAPFHVIFCLRCKEDYNWNAEVPKMLGLAPICGKGFIYEMTVSILLGLDHKPMFEGPLVHPLIPSVKAPAAIFDSIRPGEFLDENNGKAIKAWLSEGVKVDEELEALKREAREVAYMGTERMGQYWKALGAKKQHQLQPTQNELRSIAEEADTQPPGDEYDEDNPFEKKTQQDAAPPEGEEPGVV